MENSSDEDVNEIFTNRIFSSGYFQLMNNYRQENKLCDVILKVGNQSFLAHRIVLAATIPYFSSMFSHDMVEANQKEITIQGIDSK